MGEQEQRVEFETRIGAKELMDFKIYHNYHSVSGIASLLFGIIALVICIVSINRVNISYTLMMGFFGLFFTVYTPIGMKRKVNKQIKTVPAFADPQFISNLCKDYPASAHRRRYPVMSTGMTWASFFPVTRKSIIFCYKSKGSSIRILSVGSYKCSGKIFIRKGHRKPK